MCAAGYFEILCIRNTVAVATAHEKRRTHVIPGKQQTTKTKIAIRKATEIELSIKSIIRRQWMMWTRC